MLIISARENFDNPDTLKAHGHAYRDIDFQTDLTIDDFTEDKFLSKVAGKKILLLVHGYNNEQDEVYDAYTVIEDKISIHVNNQYDFVIGYSWPGGDMGLDWFNSKHRANSVARRFRFLISALSEKTNSLDIMSHSLGARVILKALKQAEEKSIIRNYYCMAAAVDNEVLEEDQEFHLSVNKVERIFVFHSSNDDILSLAYRTVEFDRALGLTGPEDTAYIQNRTKNIYVANCKKVVDSHGGYKRSDAIYQYINKVLSKKPTKFVSL